MNAAEAPEKTIKLDNCKITYTASHDWLRMTVQMLDKSKLVATVSWTRAKIKQETMKDSVYADTLKSLAVKWSSILKANDGSPLSQMLALQHSAIKILKHNF